MAAGVIICILGCGEKNKPAETVPDSTSVEDTARMASPYFPVYDFLSNEIEYVDSLPVGIMKYRKAGVIQDSGYIKLDEFHRLADEFLVQDINDSAFKKGFKETSFVDRSNGNATFFYRAEDTTLEVKRVDVVTARGDIYDEVKSIYIEKALQSGDSFIVKKLYWKPKRNFQIITVNSSGESKKNELVKVVWDNRE